jgi:uncharacterized protein YciU (UPF0263 family)
MDKRNRLGIPGVAKLAGNKFAELAKEFLNDSDFTAWQTEGEVRGFIAHNYPDGTWEGIIGFKPDRDFYSQVTIGLAASRVKLRIFWRKC